MIAFFLDEIKPILKTGSMSKLYISQGNLKINCNFRNYTKVLIVEKIKRKLRFLSMIIITKKTSNKPIFHKPSAKAYQFFPCIKKCR